MKTIGFTGGSAVCELGSVIDIQIFFDCLNAVVVPKYPEKDWSLLVDSLYKRYLNVNDVDKAAELMEEVKRTFAAQSTQSVLQYIPKETIDFTSLDLKKNTLDQVFEKYFEHFSHCVQSAKINYEGFKSYPGYKFETVRLVITDQPWYMIEKKRPLEEYDSLDDEPFWKR